MGKHVHTVRDRHKGVAHGVRLGRPPRAEATQEPRNLADLPPLGRDRPPPAHAAPDPLPDVLPAVVPRTCLFQVGEPVLYGDRAGRMRRLTVGDVSKPWRYCGLPVKVGSFCSLHASLCYLSCTVPEDTA